MATLGLRIRLLALLGATSALALGGVVPARAAPISAWLIAKRWAKGPIDTRLSASSLASALAASGYRTHVANNGLSVGRAFKVAPTASVFAVFGHAQAGSITTTDRGNGLSYKDYDAIDALTGKFPYNPGHTLSWSQYPAGAIDGVRVAILAGCETADTAIPRYGWGNFLAVGRFLGVDAVVGFRSLIYNSTTNVPQSGNYFWIRFSAYVKRGATLRGALSRARADLFRHEGHNYGYQSWAIAGAVRNPGAIKLRPARRGAKNLHHGPAVVVRDRQEGVVEYAADASTSGKQQIDARRARQIAIKFLTRNVRWFGHSRMHVESEVPSSHAPGEALTELTFRSSLDGKPGPQSADTEVDRRNGHVVYAAAVDAHPSRAKRRFRISKARAIAIARAVTGDREIGAKASADIFRNARWTVTLLDLDGSFLPFVYKVAINASNGRVQEVVHT
ncbi:MAG: hypothetical protein JOZ73_01855 [Solirubrobacterales bacterium]|nr:hypothetical protein [Solirubrobacterales bacterium]